MKAYLIAILIATICNNLNEALDNGLGLTPVMGWLSWQRYRCNIDCKNQPNECISENLYKRMADRLVKDGYRDAGYVYVNIDDCWSSHERDNATKRLRADPERFPSGIPALAKYMHDRGLKLGIYTDAGPKTCAGYPGSENYFDLDAQTFAEWGVDSLKIDGCFISQLSLANALAAMSVSLNKTGRPIFYSCCAQYIFFPNLWEVSNACNIWRTYYDVDDSWVSVKSIINSYVRHQSQYVPIARPGAFHDPDMLVIGNYGLSIDQSRVQMALWSIFASPLLMSNDLEKIDKEAREILLNKDVIAVNQDPEGKMGSLRRQDGNIMVFTRPVRPFVGKSPSLAIAVMNKNDGGGLTRYTLKADQIGLDNARGYNVTDLFDANRHLSFMRPHDSLALDVNPSGVRFIKATAVE